MALDAARWAPSTTSKAKRRGGYVRFGPNYLTDLIDA
jgi:hypothetical protein